ncbi:hypothetical protein Scep_009835 [Stephania cephalantha]|uniref:Uncharacterized protein n=1 Tax=Stephania cephalantha TaxID=152367 RepID=A0AAP0PEP1_9MAGN
MHHTKACLVEGPSRCKSEVYMNVRMAEGSAVVQVDLESPNEPPHCQSDSMILIHSIVLVSEAVIEVLTGIERLVQILRMWILVSHILHSLWNVKFPYPLPLCMNVAVLHHVQSGIPNCLSRIKRSGARGKISSPLLKESCQ